MNLKKFKIASTVIICGLLLSNCNNPFNAETEDQSFDSENLVKEAQVYSFTPPAPNYPTLKSGSSGTYVTIMKELLKKVYPQVTANSQFDETTVNYVKKFQNSQGLENDGIVGKNTWKCLLRASKGYKRAVMFNNKIVYIYESSANEKIKPGLGIEGYKERLCEMKLKGVDDSKIKAKINCGFFNMNKNGTLQSDGTVKNGVAEHSGHLLIDGVIKYTDYVGYKSWISFIYYKNGSTEIKRITSDELTQLKSTVQWVFGTSFSLIVNNNYRIDYSPETQVSPTTLSAYSMMGQKADGSFIFAVVNGETGSSGITAAEAAVIMNELGAKNAVSLDGGGSSELVTGFSTICNKSRSAERLIGSALFIYEDSKPFIYGDVNGDGMVNSIDYALLKQYILGMTDFTYKYAAQSADVNGDGSIDSMDFAFLRRYLLGSIVKFPVES
jgi:exopolysaccharide biosynthesis protein